MRAWALLSLPGLVSFAAGHVFHQGEDDVSLLQVKIATVGRAINDTIYHLHVPKVAGISFGLDAEEALAGHGLKVESREGCYAWQEGKPRIRDTAMLLRKPRGHVLSQFNFCNQGFLRSYERAVRPEGGAPMPRSFRAWLRGWNDRLDQNWHGDFTPPVRPVSDSLVEVTIRNARIAGWSVPPFSPEPRKLNPADWLTLDGGGTLWHFVKVPHQCYVPISLQAQRLSCQMPLDYRTPPSATLAIQSMHAAWFVGLTEAYQASLCLFHAKLGGPLPETCDCRNKPQLASVGSSMNRHQANDMKPGDVPEETWKLADALTVADRQLYEAARKRFVSEVREAEKFHAVRFLCDGEEEKLKL